MSNDAGKLSFVILGCGSRGTGFSKWIHEHPDAARLVAIAEPNGERRRVVSQLHGIPEPMQFESWEDLLARPRLADVAINTTMDRVHVHSALKALDLGYHMLLEKPMATTLDDCAAIDTARRRNERIVSICHSMRYHHVYKEIKRLLLAGAIGKIVSCDQLEGVDPVHQSHSFVRGNWGNESRSTFMLLAKSCHDVDIIAYLIDRPCVRVSSFGHLSHFRSECAPAGAPERCSDGCPVETQCPYSAYKVYVEDSGYEAFVGLKGKSREERQKFIQTSPYGRCVYHTDNDVVDHQVVAFEFDHGVTATFTMTAFAPGGRRLRIHGTHGFLISDIETNTIEIDSFWGQAGHQRITVPSRRGSHGGADDSTMRNLIDAVRANDPEMVLTGTSESLRTHTIAFAAELARRERRVVEISELASGAGDDTAIQPSSVRSSTESTASRPKK